MTSTSIYDSFFGPIPPGANRLQLQTTTTHVSGSGTRNAEPPQVAYNVPLSFWDAYAMDILERGAVVNALARMRLASFEGSRYFNVEADIGDAAATQLFNPVDLACDERYPQAIRAMNQFTEMSLSRVTARADKSWMRRTRSNRSGWEHFAVLDFKRPSTIDLDEIMQACINPLHLRRELARLASASAFENKSEIILRQAVHYAHTYNTPYVAFFDWDTLFLIVLADQDEEEMIGGEYCYVTVVQDKRLMRRALLGFLARAMESSLNGGERGLPQFPVTVSRRR